MADEIFDELAADANGGNDPEKTSDSTSPDWETALAEKQASVATDETVQPAGFEELKPGGAKEGRQNLDFLLDIPLNVTVELGRTKMIINRMLQITQGSIVELDKMAGEPVEIYINDKLLGKGEVVVVNDRFGVRITEIISRADRIKNIA